MKRQANALTAVLENWEDVENAIDIYANSAGSALRENEIYLDSWEAKSKAVSSAWNEFVNSFLNSDWIKGFLDGSQKVLSFFTDINAMLPIAIGFLAGGLYKAIISIIGAIRTFTVALAEAGTVAALSTGGLSVLLGIITTVIAGVVSWGISASDTAKQIENLTTKIEEQQKAIDDLNAKEKEATDLYKEYASLMSKSNAYGLTAEEKENLLQISNDLVDTYGLEVQGIDAVTGAYVIGTDAINDYVEALRAERLEKQKEQQKTRDKRIKKNLNIASDYISPSDIDDYLANAKKYYKMVQKPYEKWDDSFIQEFQQSTRGIDGLDEAMQEYLDSGDISKFETALYQSTGKYTSAINSVIKDIVTNVQVDTANILNANGESFLTQLLTPYLTNVDWEKFDHKDFEDKVEKFVSEISGTILDVSERINKRQSEISAGTLKFSGYEDMYSALKGQASILNEMLNQGIIDEKSYKEQITQLSQQIANNIGLSMVEISNKFDETDVKSKEAFEAIANNFIDLENQFKQGTISSTQYLDSLTTTISQMDFTEVFGNNKDAAQQFFTTLTSKTSNILQDTITQFEAGKISVTEYGDRLSDFAQQQKELAKNAVDEAVALGIEGKELEQIKSKYAETEEAIDSAIKKWEELRNVNKYLDENIGILNSTTSTISEGYQGFVDGLYSEFTKLSDETRANVIANMQSMEGYASISADNLLSTMQSNVGATEALANAVASETNGTLNNVVNNGGKVLSALGNAIKKFNFSITFDPNAKFSGGEFDLVKWVKSGGKKGIKLPSLTWQIKGSGGKSLQNLGTSLSNLGNSLSTYSNNIDISDYFGGNGSGNGSTGGGTVTKKDNSKDTKETFDWIEIAISRLQRTITNLGKTVSATWKSWTDRNSALKSQISAVTQEINKQQQAYNTYMSLANSVGLDPYYQALVQNGTMDISTITDETLADKIKTYQEFYEKALDAKDATIDLQDELKQLEQTDFDNIITQYEDQLSFIEHEMTMLESTVDLLENKGYVASASIYDKLIQQESSKIASLEAQYKSLMDDLASNSIKQGTEQWNDMKLEILEVKEAILESRNALVEYNNTLQELDWEVFDKLQEKIEGIVSESEFLIELMSDEKMFDNGSITEHGQAILGLHALNYKTYLENAKEYAKELEQINEELSNDPYNQTLIDRRNELLEAQRDSILASEDEKQSIKNLMSEGYDDLLSTMDELINKRKDMLNLIKDQYDYEKSIAELTSDVSKYEKMLSAYQGDDSEESRATIQKIKVSLEEAKENLEETQYDKYISDQEKMLDTLYDSAENWINGRLDNLDGLISEAISSTNANANTIKQTLETETNSVGIKLSEQMENIWNTDGALTSVISDYGNGITNQFTTLNDTLIQIRDYIAGMIANSNANLGGSDISSYKAGWEQNSNGQWSYYQNGQKLTNQWFKDAKDNQWYHLDSEGTMDANKWIHNDSGTWSYVNGSGAAVTGWQRLDWQGKKDWYSFDSEGNMHANQWIGDYFVGSGGQMLTHTWVGHNGKYYYVGDDGKWLNLPGWSLDYRPNDGYPIYEYAKGSRHIPYDQVAWTQDGGNELIRTSDGALLTRLGKGDTVFTNEMTQRLWEMAQGNMILPDIKLPSMPSIQSRYGGDTQVVFEGGIQMYGVNDPVEFENQLLHHMKNSRSVRMVMKDTTIGEALGKNSMIRYTR